MCGTLDYLPPEMGKTYDKLSRDIYEFATRSTLFKFEGCIYVVESVEHDASVDIWSLGILCYEFLYGAPPFEAEEHSDTYRRYNHVIYEFATRAIFNDEGGHLCLLHTKCNIKLLVMSYI